MSNIKIDTDKAVAKWSPVLENMGVSGADETKIEWMSEYAEQHAILENVAYANFANISGMGNVQSAQPSSLAGQTIGTSGAQQGSGDYGQQLLPVAMKIAAHTIGLDLVSVKPSPGPKIDLMYIDFEYDNTNTNKLDGFGDDEKPQVWKWVINDSVASVTKAELKTFLLDLLDGLGITEKVGGLTKRLFLDMSGADASLSTPTGSKSGKIEFLGFSRIDGIPMFRSWRQDNTASAGGTATAWGFNTALNTFANDTNMVATLNAATLGGSSTLSPAVVDLVAITDGSSVELISALEDHIPGFVSGFTSNSYPMDRNTDENTYPSIIAPRISTKTIAVGTIEVSSALKRTEIEDIKANTGMDIVQKMESILVNELSQTISKQIVDKLFEMGDLNRESAPTVASGNTIFDLDTSYVTGGPGGETTHAVQRKLITKMLNASHFIATEGRVGPAQFAVTNGNLGAALRDVIGYSINPVKSNINAQGQLYPVGVIGDVQIYVDPYQKYNDNRILVGRKNQPDQPGIVFIPYLMAQSISIISEATFAPRMLLRSRYAIGELGWYPQKQYMTINVTDVDQYLA
jgi:hypothetical protein